MPQTAMTVSGAISESQLSSALFNLQDLLNVLKGLNVGIEWNFPGDKAKLQAFIRAGADWVCSIAKAPMNFDDLLINKLTDVLILYLDSAQTIKVENQHLVVGAAMPVSEDLPESSFTDSKMSSFVAGFSSAEMSGAVRDKLMANPKALKAISKLTRENQVKLFAREDLLDLIIKFGPIILRVVMMFLL